jgi:predicted RNA-binding Zn-ribbon protein involved in translation (DUF1610 family)
MPERISRTVCGMPRQIWDRFRVFFAAMSVTALALGMSMIFVPDPWRWMAVLAMALLLITVNLAKRGAAVQSNLQLGAVGYEICIVCGYSLHGLPSESICPECGYEFQKEQLARLWKTALLGPTAIGPPEYLQARFLRSRQLFPTIMGVPRQIWRHGAWAVFVALALLAGLIASPNSTRGHGSFIVGIAPLLIIAVIVVYLMSCVRLNRRLRGVNYEVCILCGHSLADKPQQELCPDCGFVFDKSLLSEQWRFWLLGAR